MQFVATYWSQILAASLVIGVAPVVGPWLLMFLPGQGAFR